MGRREILNQEIMPSGELLPFLLFSLKLNCFVSRLAKIKKYRASQRTPNFLTWEKKEEIRELHRDDSGYWTFERLAAKYPISKMALSVNIHPQYLS